MVRGPTWKGVAGSVAVILALSPPMFATRTGAQEWQRQPPASADGCSLRLERGEKTTCMRCRAGFKMSKGLCVRMGDFGTPKRELLPRRNKSIEGIQCL